MAKKKPHMASRTTVEVGGKKKRKENNETQRTEMQRVKVYRNNRSVMEWRPWPKGK